MTYRLRFFFDPGSGVCLWSANDAARKRFDYPVFLDDLPLSDQTRETGERLIERFDTSLDWSYPPDPSPWSEAESLTFDADAREWLATAVRELGQDYEIVDEHRSVHRAS